MKILIAVPTFENIYPDTFKSIYDLDTTGHETEFRFVRGYDCARARNMIVGITLDNGFDAVLMLDNDVVMPRDALQNFVSDNVGVVYGYCARRGDGNVYTGKTTICKLHDANGIKYANYDIESMYTGKEMLRFCGAGEYLVQVHGGGMGCGFIKTDVLKKLKYPYFKWTEYDRNRQLSEDLYFCEQCRKSNIPLYVDTRVSCGHIFRHLQFAD